MQICISELVVVGAGGTGTYFLKEVSRFIHALGDEARRRIIKMVIFDGDIVDKKNIDRQCFQEMDIGIYKATVMTDILNNAFDLWWESRCIFVESKNQLKKEVGNSVKKKDTWSIPLIIGCVDNHACRVILEDFFSECDSCIYLDSANEYAAGEVVFSMKIHQKVIFPLRSSYFPEIRKKQKSRSQMSCTELNAVEPQHICTNMMAANILLSEFVAIYEGKMHGGMVVFDSLAFMMEHIPYEEETMRKIGGRYIEAKRKNGCQKIPQTV